MRYVYAKDEAFGQDADAPCPTCFARGAHTCTDGKVWAFYEPKPQLERSVLDAAVAWAETETMLDGTGNYPDHPQHEQTLRDNAEKAWLLRQAVASLLGQPALVRGGN